MHLADMGADVVKVEQPDRGDDTRSFGPPFVDEVSTYFLAVNRGKRSIALDFKSEEDKKLVLSLARRADVLVENFRPGVMERLGLGWESLRQENPRLVYCSISGFGRAEDRPGYDLMVQGLSGIPSITGFGDEPTKCGASIADLIAGMNAVQGILAALLRRGQTGKGGLVDVSMLDGQLSLLTYHASAWLNAQKEPQALGNAHPSIHPFRAYKTADAHLNLALGNDALFSQFCVLLGLEWHQDALYRTNAERVRNREALDRLMVPLMASRTTGQWLELMEPNGFPCGPILTVPQALESATLAEHAHPSGRGVVRTVGLPYKIDEAPRAAHRAPPSLGADRDSVLGDWLGT